MSLVERALKSLLQGQTKTYEVLTAHIAKTQERLANLEQPAVSTNVLQGLDARLAKVEKLLPLELPPPNTHVLAKLEYANGKTYYSVIYHDGFRWRRQGGGALSPGYERTSSYSRFSPQLVAGRVVSWTEVVLPT